MGLMRRFQAGGLLGMKMWSAYEWVIARIDEELTSQGELARFLELLDACEGVHPSIAGSISTTFL